ncbi:MAG TPA: sulfotransferase [Gammaproteobacteria bacterium]|nr:sulfotransferase [Gammaproteobacteria bacterium]
MRLPCEFVQLPLQFDAERLRAEIAQVDESEWRPHPQGYVGNSALTLVSVNGQENDLLAGPMAPTPRMQRFPYLRQVMASFQTVVGRSRLMRLEPGADVKRHADVNYYWRDRIRIHVPIVTDQRVRFHCGERDVHMQAGEAWVFDNWRPHAVTNPTDIRRVHLVVDTVGRASFWRLVNKGWNPFAGMERDLSAVRRVAFDASSEARFAMELHNLLPVAHPDSVNAVIRDLVSDLGEVPESTSSVAGICEVLENFANEWRGLWATVGTEQAVRAHYKLLIDYTLHKLGRLGADSVLVLSNEAPVLDVAQAQIAPLLDSGAYTGGRLDAPRIHVPHFDRPVIIVSAPRSGSTLLFETLARLPGLWTIGDESHGVFEGVKELRPENRGFDSNAVGRGELHPGIADQLQQHFAGLLRDYQGHHYQRMPAGARPDSVRFLEKTPKNALRIPFLDELFPDACFVFLYREPRGNVSSLMDGWQSGNFVTYRKLPGWNRGDWSFLLIPGWRELTGASLADIAAAQWLESNRAIMEALAVLPRERWCALSYAELIEDPARSVSALAGFAGLRVPDGALPDPSLPLSRYTLSQPDPEKWLRNEAEILRVMPQVQTLWEQLQSLDAKLF